MMKRIILLLFPLITVSLPVLAVDTIKIVDHLKEGGFDDTTARLIADVAAESVADLATKASVEALSARIDRLETRIDRLETRIVGLATKEDIALLWRVFVAFAAAFLGFFGILIGFVFNSNKSMTKRADTMSKRMDDMSRRMDDMSRRLDDIIFRLADIQGERPSHARPERYSQLAEQVVSSEVREPSAEYGDSK